MLKKIILHLQKNKQKMKKLMSLLAIAGFIFVIGCGPSDEEKAAIAKATQDSLAAVAKKAMDDSLASAQAAVQKAMEDSVNAAKMQAMQDSINALQGKMDKVVKDAKPKKPKLLDPSKKDLKPEEVKPGQGRG